MLVGQKSNGAEGKAISGAARGTRVNAHAGVVRSPRARTLVTMHYEFNLVSRKDRPGAGQRLPRSLLADGHQRGDDPRATPSEPKQFLAYQLCAVGARARPRRRPGASWRFEAGACVRPDTRASYRTTERYPVRPGRNDQLEQFLGSAHGLSAATVTRLTADWQTEATAGHQGTRLPRRRHRHGLSSSSSPHKPAGARSTYGTWSPWSALARGSRTASSSNDPTNQEAISKPRNQGGHQTGRHVGQRELPVRFGCLTGRGA